MQKLLMRTKILVKITLDGRPAWVEAGLTDTRTLLRALDISPQEALVKVNGKVRPEGTPFSKKDKLEVIRVVFGG